MSDFTPNTEGIFFDLPEQNYRLAPGVAQSDLKEIAKSPAHYRARITGPRESTESQIFGSLGHLAVLEPERLKGSYVIRPDGMKFTTKEGKAWKESQVLPIIDQEQNEALTKIAENISNHPIARRILREGTKTEVSVFRTHEATGLLRKGRIDALTTDNDELMTIADVKTTDDASLEGFARQIVKWGYHRQAAYYLDMLGASFFCFIVVEKAAPFAVNVFSLDEESLAIGRKTYEAELRLLAECQASNNWPAYGDNITEISVPRWFKMKEAA